MTAFEEMYEASFRGVQFFIKRATTTGGRKVASHDFVNSDVREVEDLGEDLFKFNVIGTINETGGSFLQLKRNLISALTQPGPGKLIHPFYGEFEVVALPYSIDEDVKRIGEATFSMSFELEKAQVIVKDTFATIGDIAKLKDEFTDKLGLDTAKKYFASTLAAINAAGDFVNQVADAIDGISSLYTQAFDTVSGLISSVQSLKNNIVTLTNLPDRMVTDLEGLFTQIDAIFVSKKTEIDSTGHELTQAKRDAIPTIDTTETEAFLKERGDSIIETEEISDLDSTIKDLDTDKITAIKSLFGFNKDSVRVEAILSASGVTLEGDDAGITAAASSDIGNLITSEEAEIIDNEKALTNLIKGNALASAYQSAIDADYQSIDEIELIQADLESEYQEFVADQSASADVLRTLYRFRNAVERFLFEKKLTTNSIIEVEIQPMPAQILSFMLYGDNDRYEDLIILNDEIDISRIEGTKKALTA